MKVQVEIDIFPDPELCHDQDVCKHFNGAEGWCGIYAEYLEYLNTYGYKKCDQCKAVYLKAKLEEPTDLILIDGYRFNCWKKRLYLNNGTIEATLICDEQDRLEFVKKFKTIIQVPISTHDGLFNNIGLVHAKAMHIQSPGKMEIEIIIGIQR